MGKHQVEAQSQSWELGLRVWGGTAGEREILEGQAPRGSAGSRERALPLHCLRSGTRRAQLVII